MRETDRQTCRKKERKTDRQRERQIGRQAGRQTDRDGGGSEKAVMERDMLISFKGREGGGGAGDII